MVGELLAGPLDNGVLVPLMSSEGYFIGRRSYKRSHIISL